MTHSHWAYVSPTVADPPPLPTTTLTFTPAVNCGTGLHLLASAAAAAQSGSGLVRPATQQDPTLNLYARGPYNPAAVLPPRVAKKSLDLEFVEISEISLEDLPAHTHGPPTNPEHLSVG